MTLLWGACWVAVFSVTLTNKTNLLHNGNLESVQFSSSLNFSKLKTDHSLVDYTPFVAACYFEMTFSPVLWTDVLMMHEMCRLAVLVLFQCSVPASKIGHRCSYVIFMRLKLSIQRERTFYALHMGTGQQMSIPVIHISCQNWNVSPIHHTRSNKVSWRKYSLDIHSVRKFKLGSIS